MHDTPLISRHYLTQLQRFLHINIDADNSAPDLLEAATLLDRWHQLEQSRPVSLAAGAQSHPLQFGLTGSLAAQAENLHQALQQISEFSALYNQLFQCHLSEQVDAYCYTLASTGFNDDSCAPLLEFEIAALINFLVFLSGPDPQTLEQTSIEIHLRHPSRQPVSYYQKYLHCGAIKFSQPENRLILSKDFLQQKVFAASPRLFNLLHQEANLALENINQSLSLPIKVKRLIKQQRQPQVPDIKKTASDCGLSISSFKRQLAQQGLSYQQIINQVQQQKAQQLLRDPQHNVADIAYQLGFANTSGFHRAFKRWTGLTPTAFRENLRSRSKNTLC